MSVRLTLICHAPTAAIRAASFPLDEPLDALGEAQAAALAGQFGPADAVWTSPALRARQTAGALKLAAATDPALRDIELGRWAGQSLAGIAAAEPGAVEAWTTDPAAAPHGGEAVIDLIERVRPWLENQAEAGRRSIAVTHAAVIRAVIILAIEASPLSFWRLDIAPLCRVDLRGGAGAWKLRAVSPCN